MTPKKLFVTLLTSSALLTIAATLYGLPSSPNADRTGLQQTSRSEEIVTALRSGSGWDCLSDVPISPPSPLEAEFFEVTSRTVLPTRGWDLSAAAWSPEGDAILFVMPTDSLRRVSGARQGSGAALIGVSVNQLWLLDLETHEWLLISNDGSSPRFSADGERIFYISGVALKSYNLRDRSTQTLTGEATSSAVGLVASQPLRDGSLLAPQKTHDVVQVLGTTTNSWKPLQLLETDRLFPSPDDRFLAVSYSASEEGAEPSLVRVYAANGEATTVLRDCPYSATQLSWSPDGSLLAYPTLGSSQTVNIFDLGEGTQRVVLDTTEPGLISGITWSPDSMFLAFAHGDHREALPIVWVLEASGSGRQPIGQGILPSWSPKGDQILVAIPGENGAPLAWAIITLRTAH